MNLNQIILKNKPRAVLLAMGGIELVALALFWLSLGPDVSVISQDAPPPPRQNPPRQAAVNLQFLEPRNFDDYRPETNRNPFKGPMQPVQFVRQPVRHYQPPPQPQPPPRPKQQIIVTYRGIGIFPPGEPQALLEDKTDGQQHFVKIGAQVYSYEVSAFDADKLILKAGDLTMELPRSEPTVIEEH